MASFQDHIAELEQTWYEDDTPSAFRHAAFRITTDFALSDNQVIELTAIDKSGDLEVDGWYVDDEKQAVVLFQSMGGATKVEEGKVTKFWLAPEALLDPDRVQQSNNQSVKELSKLLDEHLRDEYNLELVFAANGGFVPSAISFAAPKGGVDRQFTLLDGSSVTCRCDLKLLTAGDLEQIWEDHKADPRPESFSVELKTRPEWIYQISHDDAHSVHVTLPAEEIVRVFETPGIGFRLFASNPRGPLVHAKVNRRITETLKTEEGRRDFHLLNNGICAICKSFEVDEGSISIKGLQIVNGCQTTVTLKDQREILGDTLVNVKIGVADDTLSEKIAIASNSQSALKARDYTAFEKQQRALQYDFDHLQPPWYYELKQGYWGSVLTDAEKGRYLTGKRTRRVEVQPLAQAALAFGGFPSEAFDRVRFVFQGIRSTEDRHWYERAFPTNVKVVQLLLPWRMLSYLQKRKERVNFSTFHLLWLIAGALRKKYQLQEAAWLSPETSTDLAHVIDTWIPGYFRITNAAAQIAVMRAKNIVGADAIDQRDFFREYKTAQLGIYPLELLKKAFEDELAIAKEVRGEDPAENLP